MAGKPTSVMIKNYFKIAWRNLAKSKGYSVINIGGLAVGMAVAMLIGLWCGNMYEWSQDYCLFSVAEDNNSFLLSIVKSC